MLFMRWDGGRLSGVLFLRSYFKYRIGVVKNLFTLIEGWQSTDDGTKAEPPVDLAKFF